MSQLGRANKRNGRSAEKGLEKLLQSWGYEAKRIPMSGALKYYPGFCNLLSSDLKFYVDGEEYLIESKRRQDSNGWYALAEEGIVHIEGFCYLLRQGLMKKFLTDRIAEVDKTIPDEKFKILHKYFEQDDADIVTVYRPWCEYLFFIKEDAFERLKNKKEETS